MKPLLYLLKEMKSDNSITQSCKNGLKKLTLNSNHALFQQANNEHFIHTNKSPSLSNLSVHNSSIDQTKNNNEPWHLNTCYSSLPGNIFYKRES